MAYHTHHLTYISVSFTEPSVCNYEWYLILLLFLLKEATSACVKTPQQTFKCDYLKGNIINLTCSGLPSP